MIEYTEMIEYKEIRCELDEVPKEGNYHVINSKGDQYWFVNGKCHRDNDLPAVILTDGTQKWYQHGKCHRDNDLPAVIFTNGDQFWFVNGEYHRYNDLPAIIWFDGSQEWYKDGEEYTPKPKQKHEINSNKTCTNSCNKEELKKALHDILDGFKLVIDNL